MMSFRDVYVLEMQQKRQVSRQTQLTHDLQSKRTTTAVYNQLDSAKNFVDSAARDLAALQARVQPGIPNPGLDAEIASKQAELKRDRDNLEKAQLNAIRQTLADNEALNGKNKNLRPEEIMAKFLVLKSAQPGIDPLAFTEGEIRKAKPSGYVARTTNATQRLADAARRFRDIVQGRPDGQQAAQVAMDHFRMFDPGVCGLTALDNEGNVLADDRFNLPFMFVKDIKDSKSSSWESTSPHGRFEPFQVYTGGEPYIISMELGYMATESGQNTDEGAIQELKDRWLATQYPIYGKNQRNGVRAYGTPNSYLLNLLSRYVNIPVSVQAVSIGEEYGYDPQTWFSMGFRMTVEFKTKYRLSQVISADDIVTRGLRSYSHKQF